LHYVVWWKFTDVSEVLAAYIFRTLVIALITEEASTCKASVNFYQTTWHNSPGDIHLHTHHHENLKSHKVNRNSKDNLQVQLYVLKIVLHAGNSEANI
jgi:hypothetical protein